MSADAYQYLHTMRFENRCATVEAKIQQSTIIRVYDNCKNLEIATRIQTLRTFTQTEPSEKLTTLALMDFAVNVAHFLRLLLSVLRRSGSSIWFD